MNLNYRVNEYNLIGTQIEELIRIYGLKIKWIFTEKIKQDSIFGEFSHFKADNKSVFEVYAMPENTDDFDDIERLQTQFPGVLGDGTLNLFISKITARELMQKSLNTQNEIDITAMDKTIQRLHGSLIILPAGKVMEVTKIDLDVPGAGNQFLNAIDKVCYVVHCKTYIHKTANEISVDTQITDPESLDQGKTPDMFDTLDKYFDEMVKRNETQKTEAQERFEKDDPVFGRF